MVSFYFAGLDSSDSNNNVMDLPNIDTEQLQNINHEINLQISSNEILSCIKKLKIIKYMVRITL